MRYPVQPSLHISEVAAQRQARYCATSGDTRYRYLLPPSSSTGYRGRPGGSSSSGRHPTCSGARDVTALGACPSRRVTLWDSESLCPAPWDQLRGGADSHPARRSRGRTGFYGRIMSTSRSRVLRRTGDGRKWMSAGEYAVPSATGDLICLSGARQRLSVYRAGGDGIPPCPVLVL